MGSYMTPKERELVDALFLQAHQESLQHSDPAEADTSRSCRFVNAIRVAVDLGFEEIYSQVHRNTKRDSNEDVYFILMWKDGVILELESYRGFRGGDITLNKGILYGNWRPDPGVSPFYLAGSGHCTRVLPGSDPHEDPKLAEDDPWVFAGYYHMDDGGLRRFMDRAYENGEFLTEWLETPAIYFVSYADEPPEDKKNPLNSKIGYSYIQVQTKEKINQLPEPIRAMIWDKMTEKDREEYP